MKDKKWERDLFQMAGRERLIPPASLDQKINRILDDLPKQHRAFRMTWKKSVILAAALIAAFSFTAVAAVSVWRQRMEAINEQ